MMALELTKYFLDPQFDRVVFLNAKYQNLAFIQALLMVDP